MVSNPHTQPHKFPAQMKVLELLYHHGPVELPEGQRSLKGWKRIAVRPLIAEWTVAQGYKITDKSAKLQLGLLIRNGWVFQEHPLHIALTDAGRELYESMPEPMLDRLRSEVPDPTEPYFSPHHRGPERVITSTAEGTVTESEATEPEPEPEPDELRSEMAEPEPEAAEPIWERNPAPEQPERVHDPAADDPTDVVDYPALAYELLTQVTQVLAGDEHTNCVPAEDHEAVAKRAQDGVAAYGQLRASHQRLEREVVTLGERLGDVRAEAERLREHLASANQRIGELQNERERFRANGYRLRERLDDEQRGAIDKLMRQLPSGR